MNKHTDDPPLTIEYEPHFLFLRFVMAFALGYALPTGYAVYEMHLESVYYASLPDCSNCGRCGLSGLGPFLLTCFVAPVSGLISARMTMAYTFVVATSR